MGAEVGKHPVTVHLYKAMKNQPDFCDLSTAKILCRKISHIKVAPKMFLQKLLG